MLIDEYWVLTDQKGNFYKFSIYEGSLIDSDFNKASRFPSEKAAMERYVGVRRDKNKGHEIMNTMLPKRISVFMV